MLTTSDMSPQDMAEPGTSRSARILLAEDSPTNAIVASTMLKKAGFEVINVSSGTEVLDAVQSGDFDLILMDVFMPEMDGLQATGEIRQLGGDKARVPIIAMTAYAVESDRERCLAVGMNDYVAKPINKQNLLNKIDQWLGSAGDGGVAIAEAPAQGDHLLDIGVLERLEQNAEPGMLLKLVSTFISETAARLERIRVAIDRQEFAALEHEALALKSASGTFGAVRLQQCTSALEQACLSHDTARAIELVRSLPKVAFAASKALAERYARAR